MFTIYPKAVKVFKAVASNEEVVQNVDNQTAEKPATVETQVAQSGQKAEKVTVTASDLTKQATAVVKQGLGRLPEKAKFKKFGNNECYTIVEKDDRDVFKTFVKNGWVDQKASYNGKELRHPDFPGVLIGLGYPNDIDEDEATKFGVDIENPRLCCIMVTTNSTKASATVTAALKDESVAAVRQGLGRTAPKKLKFKKFGTNECYTIVEKDSRDVFKTFVKNGWVDQRASYNGKELRHPDFPGVLIGLGYPNDIEEEEATKFGVDLEANLCCIMVTTNSTKASATVTAAKAKTKAGTKTTKKPTKALIGLFYSYYKRPLNYLFSILAKPRKTAEQKETVKSLMSGLRKAEVKFQKENKFTDSIVDLLINQRSLKLGKLEASFDEATASAVETLAGAGEVGLFYNMHKRPLSYLFALLKSPKLEKSDKKIVDSLIKGLRKSETAFMKENGVKQSIIDKLLKQRKLKLEASATVTAKRVSAEGAKRTFKRILPILSKQWGVQLTEGDFSVKNDTSFVLPLDKVGMSVKQFRDKLTKTGWKLSDSWGKHYDFYVNAKYSGAAINVGKVTTSEGTSYEILFVVLNESEANATVTAKRVSVEGAKRTFKRMLPILSKQWGVKLSAQDFSVKNESSFVLPLDKVGMSVKEFKDTLKKTGWKLSDSWGKHYEFYVNTKYSGAAINVGKVTTSEGTSYEIMFVVLNESEANEALN